MPANFKLIAGRGGNARVLDITCDWFRDIANITREGNSRADQFKFDWEASAETSFTLRERNKNHAKKPASDKLSGRLGSKMTIFSFRNKSRFLVFCKDIKLVSRLREKIYCFYLAWIGSARVHVSALNHNYNWPLLSL